MAQAVKELFPAAKVTIGPAVENGFYYDFDVATPLAKSPDSFASRCQPGCEPGRITPSGRVVPYREKSPQAGVMLPLTRLKSTGIKRPTGTLVAGGMV